MPCNADTFAISASNRIEKKSQPDLAWLEARLLSFGGCAVRLVYEVDLDLLQSRGQAWQQSVVRPGPYARMCHANAALAYQRARGRLRLATGWALGPDGVWVQHSWTLDGSVVVEPTDVTRLLYFGFIATEEEAANFVASVEMPEE